MGISRRPGCIVRVLMYRIAHRIKGTRSILLTPGGTLLPLMRVIIPTEIIPVLVPLALVII